MPKPILKMNAAMTFAKHICRTVDDKDHHNFNTTQSK